MNISHDSGGNICVMGDATPNTLGKFLDAEGAIASLAPIVNGSMIVTV